MPTKPVYFDYKAEYFAPNILSVGKDCAVNFPDYDKIIITKDSSDCSDYTTGGIWCAPEWLPLEHRVSEEVEENGFGQEEIIRRRVERIHSFRVTSDEYNKRLLYELIYSTQFLQIISAAGSQDKHAISIVTENANITEEETGVKGLFILTVSFKVKENKSNAETDEMTSFGVESCCDDLYAEAPYEDSCNEGGQGGCELGVSIIESGGVLTATQSGGTAPAYTWYLKEEEGSWIQIGSGSSADMNIYGYGQYRVVAREDGCMAQDEYYNPNPCRGFRVQIRRDGDALLAEGSTGDGLSYTWEWYDSDNDTWVSDGGDDSILIPSKGDGIYRVRVTNNDGCEAEDVFEIVSIGCGWDVDIQEDNSVLEAIPDTGGNYTFDWDIDRGDGTGWHSLNNQTQFVNLNESGAYRVTVEDDNNCVVQAYYVYIGAGTACENTDVVITEAQGQLSVTLNPQPNQATYRWYLFEEGDGGFISIGAGSSVNITVDGVYKVKAWWDNCVKEAIYLINR